VYAREDEYLHGSRLFAVLEDCVEDLLDFRAFARIGRAVLAVARVFVGVVDDLDFVWLVV
jgi:hypothetical protein